MPVAGLVHSSDDGDLRLFRVRFSPSLSAADLSVPSISTGCVIFSRDFRFLASLLSEAGGSTDKSGWLLPCPEVCLRDSFTNRPFLLDPYSEIPRASATVPRSLSPRPLISSSTTCCGVRSGAIFFK